MRFFRIIALMIFLVSFKATAQDYRTLFNQTLNKNYAYSFSGIQSFAKGNNAYDYMSISYFIDANNTMYKKTGEEQYLDNNMSVLKEMYFKEDSPALNARVMKVDAKNQNASINGQESLVFEGYFYRYLGEFIFILKQNNQYQSVQKDLIEILVNHFDKWRNKSRKKYNDDSNLFHQRFHIGATWAMTSLYLYNFTAKTDYKQFYTNFDKQLKLALTTKKIHNKNCYIWNSTYPSTFTKALKSAKKINPIIQDVSHGNHVVEYMITSYELNTGVYSKNDLKNLANTVLELVWRKSTISFGDNVDGTMSKDKSLRNSGWKQSDGWMKLIAYNSDLKEVYSSYYKKNFNKILKSSLSLQYIANLY